MAGPIKGVYCAAATPVDENLNPDLVRLADHAKRLIADGCHGVAMLGSTGEANSFSLTERKAMLEAVVNSGVAGEKLLPGTGVPSFPETIELTKHALSVGVRTVVMLPPFYYKGVTNQGLIDSYSRVIDGIGDNRLQVILYHIPPIAQIAIPAEVISALLEKFPGTFVGVKDSGGDIEHMKMLVNTFPNLSILAGADPFMLPLLKEGGAGCITATSNIVGAQLRTVFDNFDQPEFADAVEAAQARIVSLRNLSNSYVQIPTIKTMVAHKYGKDEAWCRTRPPFVALDAAARKAVFAQLDAA
jgi:4-hydroxy-tetrahydrodipicolinate synthase